MLAGSLLIAKHSFGESKVLFWVVWFTGINLFVWVDRIFLIPSQRTSFALFICFILLFCFVLFICFILNLYWFDKFIYSNLFSSNFLKEINKNKQLLLIATPGLVKEHKHWKSVHNDKLTFIWKFQIDPNFSLLLEEKISYRKILFSVKTFNINNIYKKRRIQIKFLEFKRRYSSGPRDLHTWWFSVISMI